MKTTVAKPRIFTACVAAILAIGTSVAMADINLNFRHTTVARTTAPAASNTITFDFTVGGTGNVTLDASTNSSNTAIINSVNSWDGAVGTVAKTSLFGTSFQIVMSSSTFTNATSASAATAFAIDGRYTTGMIGVVGDNASRIDGPVSDLVRERLTFTLSAGGPAIKLKSFNWDFASAVTLLADAKLLSGGTSAIYLNMPGTAGTSGSLPSYFGTTDTSAAGLTLGSGANALVFTTPLVAGESFSHGYGLSGMTLEFPDGIVPPVGLTATTNGVQVNLDWADDPAEALAFYTVKRSDTAGGTYTQVATNLTASNFIDTTVVTGNTYYYVVTATDTSPSETANSNEASSFVRIQPPTGLTRIQGNGAITLDWADNTSGILDFYTVYRSETPGGPYTSLATSLTTSDYSDTTAINGTTYYYVVTATDNLVVIASTNSAQVSGTPFAPVAGTALYAHLDGSVSTNVTADGSNIVSLWADLTANLLNASSTGGVGTVTYPSANQSPTFLDGLDFGFTPTGSPKSSLLWFSPAAQDAWLNFNDGAAAAPYNGFTVFAVVRPDAILAGSNRDVVLSSTESSFALRYEGGRPQIILGSTVLQGTVGAAVAGETLVLAVNYNAATGQLELWDSKSGITTTATRAVGDFSSSAAMLLGGSINSDQYMQGFIGEVKLYRGAMTPAEFATERSTLDFKWSGLKAPSGLVASSGPGTVVLDWNDQVADFYTVYRGTETGSYTQLATNIPTSNYADNTVTAGTPYFYVVSATKSSVESPQSAELPVTPGSTLFAHLDGSISANVTADVSNIVSLWSDLTANDRDASSTGGIGTVLYPSSAQSESGLNGLDFGFTNFVAPATNAKSALLWFDEAAQDSWLNFNSVVGAKPYSGFAVFTVVHPNTILAGANRDVVMGSTESSFSIRYEGGRPQVRLGPGASPTILQGTVGAAKVGETLVIAVNYNASTGQLELWDSESGLTTTATRAAGDFSATQGFFLGGTVNPDQYMKGMIGEAKIYRGNMTPSEFSAERSALATKWIGASGSSFSSWQTANATAGGLDEDHDGDGVDNGVEFFLGGASDTTGFTSLPGVVNTAGTLSVTWTKATSYGGTYGTDFWIETSATLSPPWTQETAGVNVAITIDAVNGDAVKYTFPAGSKNFARLRVTGP
jgi:fibronectin type 3 domain-containing protein